jgi:hypothetical protein
LCACILDSSPPSLPMDLEILDALFDVLYEVEDIVSDPDEMFNDF